MKKLGFALGIGLFFLGSLFGEELYVSPVPIGNSCNQTFPCSFQTALSRVENNGESDTIYVSPGTYMLLNTLQVDIKDERRLTVRALDPNDSPVLDGGGALRIMYVSYLKTSVTIDGLVFRNGNARQGGALYVVGELSQGFTVRNSVFVNNTALEGGAVYLYNTVNKAFILGNRFEGNSSSGLGSALYMPCRSNTLSDFSLIERNVFVDNVGDATVYLNVSPGNCSFTGNLLVNNNYANLAYGVLSMDVYGRAHVINNTFYGSDMAGAYVVLKTPSAEVNLYNNIIWNTGLSLFSGRSLSVIADSGGVRVFNNIFGQEFTLDPDADGTPDDTVISEGVYLKETDPSRYHHGSNLFTDPQFLAPQAGNFGLEETSPAVDSGTSDLPSGAYMGSKDLSRNPRVLDGDGDGAPVVDRGAVEYNPAGSPTGGGCSSIPASAFILWLAPALLLKRFLRL
ncbi:right-handed parallel beta-helix repeat-containing protein [Hydrogenivirga sp.]